MLWRRRRTNEECRDQFGEGSLTSMTELLRILVPYLSFSHTFQCWIDIPLFNDIQTRELNKSVV